jgi:ketosteroid isomerase-like protein
MADGAPTPGEVLGQIYALAGARDWAGVEALMHPDVVIHEAASLPFAGEWRGKDALQRLSVAMYGTWAEASVEIHDITSGKEWAVVVLTLTMTSKKTGNTFSQTLCEAGRIEGGLLKEHRIHYFDAAQIAEEA